MMYLNWYKAAMFLFTHICMHTHALYTTKTYTNPVAMRTPSIALLITLVTKQKKKSFKKLPAPDLEKKIYRIILAQARKLSKILRNAFKQAFLPKIEQLSINIYLQYTESHSICLNTGILDNT